MSMDYKRIFWGIFIATFRLTIGIITLLPAFVGWILVLTALSDFKENSSEGDSAGIKTGAILLVLASLGGDVISFLAGGNFKTLHIMLFYPLFVIVIELVVFHKILEVSVCNFNEMDHQEIVDKYIGKDRTYIILMGISIVLLAISLTTNHQIIGVIGAVITIISRIYLMTVINSLSKENLNRDDKEDYSSDKYKIST